MSHNYSADIILSHVVVIKITKKIRLCIFFLAAVSFLLASSGLAIAGIEKDDQAKIRQVIEQYIKDNPEVLRDALIGLAKKEERASISAGLAKVRLDSGDPVMGNVDGRLVIYEFSDYNCGYCKRMFPSIQQILAKNNDIRLVVKEFPILGQSSLTAARAGVAAQKQGKFPAFHKEMITYRGQVSDDSIMAAARSARLDLEQFREDIASPAISAIIDRTRAGAAALGINGTPALVVGETIISGAVSVEELQNVIDLERAKQGQAIGVTNE